MVASLARIEANRRNSQLSTGPKSPEGKERSRANSLKHGLTARVLRTELDERAAEDWARRCPEAAASNSVDAAWLGQEVAVLADRLGRIARIEARDRERAALRAASCWDEDGRRAAEALGATIARRPGEVVGLLEATPRGCDWLIARWAMLARVAAVEGAWDEATRSLAFDLLGTPPAARKGAPGQRIAGDGSLLDDARDPAAVARAEVVRLSALREKVAPLDDFERESTRRGIDQATGLVERRLRNYESALHRRLRWALDRLAETPTGPAVAPDPIRPSLAPIGPSLAAIEPNPAPVGPEADPDEAPAPPPSPAPTRHDRRARKVERRREAAGRKRDRLLGEAPGASARDRPVNIGR